MNKKILIVYDSSTARSIISHAQETSRFGNKNVGEAENGKEILENTKHDLVFTDLNMPQMDGEQLLKELKVQQN